MDYDQIVLRLYESLDEDQKKIFRNALKKARQKDKNRHNLHDVNETSNRSLSASPKAE